MPELARRKDGRGRPWRENRAVLNGILWILRTGAPWADLPDRYPSYQTCHRRFQQWVRAGVLRSILEVLAQALHDEGYLDLQEAYIDGSFASAKQGGACVGKTKRGKGSKIMAIADRQGLPVAVHVESALGARGAILFRVGSTQTVQVVHVSDGGQAVVAGRVSRGDSGRGEGGGMTKKPHDTDKKRQATGCEGDPIRSSA